MIASMEAQKPNFTSALTARGRSAEIREADDLYGWAIGSWELDVLHYGVDVSALAIKGQAHFGWVLEGRVLQDVWIMPRIADRKLDHGKANNMYGTTLRVWDGSIGAWRITWINPVTGVRDELIGRRSGSDIVQVGRHADGTPIRWSFTEITPDSFRWTGEVLEPDGTTWRLEGEFRARRVR